MSRNFITEWQQAPPDEEEDDTDTDTEDDRRLPDEMDKGGESGASSTEYAVLLGIIVIIGVIGYITLSGQMNRIFQTIAF